MPRSEGRDAVLDETRGPRDGVVERARRGIVLVGQPDDPVGIAVTGEIHHCPDQRAPGTCPATRRINIQVLQVAIVGGRPCRWVEEAVDNAGDGSADFRNEPMQSFASTEAIKGVARICLGHRRPVERQVTIPEGKPCLVITGLDRPDCDGRGWWRGGSHAGMVPDAPVPRRPMDTPDPSLRILHNRHLHPGEFTRSVWV